MPSCRLERTRRSHCLAGAAMRGSIVLAALSLCAACAHQAAVSPNPRAVTLDSSHAGAALAAGIVEAHPLQSTDVVINPGTGWQVIVSNPPAGEMDHMPLISTYYYRTSWVNFEPEKGQYEGSPAVKMIDAWLAEARRHGRYVAFRVVPWNSGNSMHGTDYSRKFRGHDTPVPPYIFAEGADGFPEPYDTGGWVPVFWDPIYLKYHRSLVEFQGKRYGDDPNIAFIDVPAGNYGEMNLTNTEEPAFDDLSIWKQHGLTAKSWSAMLHSLCDMYRAAFPNDLLVAARDYTGYPGGEDAVPYAVSKGIGFRDDGLGMDYCGPGRANPEYEGNWKGVPCLYENGGGSWLNWGGESQIRAILDWAIDRTHATIVMVGKSRRALTCYDQYLPLVRQYGLRLGYRLVIQTARWPGACAHGSSLPVTLTWRNLGNAPPYVDFALELSLIGRDRHVICSDVSTLHTHRWLPGSQHSTNVVLNLPAALAPGDYSVAASLFERNASGGFRRRIRLAIEGEQDGRYPLGTLHVE